MGESGATGDESDVRVSVGESGATGDKRDVIVSVGESVSYWR